jgi:plastocyanin
MLMAVQTFVLLTLAFVAHASGIDAVVHDRHGKPVADAVISLIPADPTLLSGHDTQASAEMDQRQKQFVPYVLPVKTGTRVRFPNKDRIKHHVYSFSPAKRFELKLYGGDHKEPVVLFDKPGMVALGCNIHDWMLGYVYVLNTPWFGKTDETGTVVIDGIPEGRYTARVWHPRLRGNNAGYEKSLTLQERTQAQTSFAVSLKRERRRHPPEFDEEVY